MRNEISVMNDPMAGRASLFSTYVETSVDGEAVISTRFSYVSQTYFFSAMDNWHLLPLLIADMKWVEELYSLFTPSLIG